MYNVLIADDEIEVREGLKLKVDWQACGFQITGEAANGLEAESLLKSGHYDLLITDMSMPVMDGVKLLDVCRSYIPDIRIVIITGYEDFQYARAGVRSQAADYLLKPVARDDLKSALERIKASLDKERKVRDESEMMQWRLSQYYLEMKGRFLMDLVKGGRIPSSSLAERLRLFHLDAWQETEVCFITAGIRSTRSRKEAGGRDLEQLRLPFHMLCYELAQLHSENIQVFRDHANAATVHYVIAGGLQQEFARRLTEQADALLNVDVLIGIGRPVTGLARWKEGYLHSLLAWNMAWRQGGPAPAPVTDHSPLLPEETSRTLHRCLVRGQMDALRDIIRKELRDAFAISSSRFYRCIFQISLLMESILADVPRDLPEREPIGLSPDWVLLMESPEQAERLLMEWAQQYAFGERETHAEQTVIESAKRYIEEHYMQDLTLTNLAEQYNYHPTYFSEMFKEGAGVTFIQYVTEVRMRQAVRLLTETGLTVWDIAELVGFSSPGYFSSKFKKMFHISPSDFRLAATRKKQQS